MIVKNRKLTAAMVAAGVLSASILVGQVHAQEVGPAVSNTGTGSAVVVPYYTVNAGWATLLNVTNTTGNSLVIKVRLHEARNSRDVLDFNVALSPYDVWTASITEGPDGAPRVSTNDTSCTIPISVRDSGASAQKAAFVNTPQQGQWADHTQQGDPKDRMSEGYVEILVMGETAGAGIGVLTDAAARALTTRDGNVDQTAWFAKHVDGEPRNCKIVENDFDTVPVGTGTFNDTTAMNTTNIPLLGTGNPIARTAPIGYGPISSPAPLKVNATLVNFGEGKAAGVESLHIAGYGQGANLVTAQVFPWFLEPTLVSGGELWSMDGLDAINAGIAATRVINEWTSNPNTGANAEWVVTFPTKRFYADNHHQNVQAACSRWRNTATANGFPAGSGVSYGFPATSAMAGANYNELCPAAPFLSAPGDGTFQDNDDGRSRITVSYDIFDREEDSFEFTPEGGVTISPAPPPPPREVANLNYEVNVLRVGRDLDPEDESVLGSKIAGPVDVDLEATVGWMAMTFGEDGLNNAAPNALPVTGFVFKMRDFGDPSLNFAQSTEHAYERSDLQPNG